MGCAGCTSRCGSSAGGGGWTQTGRRAVAHAVAGVLHGLHGVRLHAWHRRAPHAPRYASCATAQRNATRSDLSGATSGDHDFTHSTQLLHGLPTFNAPLSVGQCGMWFVTICIHCLGINRHLVMILSQLGYPSIFRCKLRKLRVSTDKLWVCAVVSWAGPGGNQSCRTIQAYEAPLVPPSHHEGFP